MKKRDTVVNKIGWLLLLGIFFVVNGLSSCAPNALSQGQDDQILPTPTEQLNYGEWEQTLLMEGKYSRDEACSASFSYQYRQLGFLTVSIATSVDDELNSANIYQTIFQKMEQLAQNDWIEPQIPITVFVIPDTLVENCVSNGAVIFTSPKKLTSADLVEEMAGGLLGVSAQWVKTGLAYLASNEPINTSILQDWYQETDDLDILGLFVARFKTDWVSEEEVQIARMTAASLVQFCMADESMPVDEMETGITNDLRTRWLNSIGVQRVVSYPYDGLYPPYQFSTTEECSLVAQSDEIRFCLNRLPEEIYFDEVDEAEYLIYQADTGYKALVDYLLTNAPSVTELTKPQQRITIEVQALDVLLGYTEGSTIRIHNSAVYYDVLTEMVHTFAWNQKLAFANDNLMLAEGFAEYLGKLLPIYDQTDKAAIWDDLSGWEADPGISYWFRLDSEQLDAARAWYLAQGGDLDSREAIDPRLFTDAMAFASLYRNAYGGPLGISIEEKAARLHQRLEVSAMEGVELNYIQAASYVAWLCDTYGLDEVMQRYVLNDKTKLDGKNYEDLKLEWIATLIDKGSGIPVPDSPK